MTRDERNRLFQRNKRIIEQVMHQIQAKYYDDVDMVAIAGSFASGDFYEKSDLDLVIVKNDDVVDGINTCFIMDDVGYDIYTIGWEDFEKMAEYKNPFVTKLKNLNVIYTRDPKVGDKYREMQVKLRRNMRNDGVVNNNISNLFAKVINTYGDSLNCNNLNEAYKVLGNFMEDMEAVVYLLNKTYVKSGTKNIPEDIFRMKNLPAGFTKDYMSIPKCTRTSEIVELISNMTLSMERFLRDKGIEIKVDDSKKETKEKRDIKSDDLTGTYEELYSNYFNKMIHASETKNQYLSFRTMVDAQKFIDEYSDSFNISKIDLVGNYNPDNLVENSKSFGKVLDRWKDLYDKHYKKINVISSPKEIYNNRKKPFLAFETETEKKFMKGLE